ncbi:MATE family efflux transporter [Caulobacter radicis]|uniref:MATE family efflux transporter n=1 Tax=Caulobacter radicis TaxID=2172650 RepID=UPI0014036C5D|nr:MATE family efflux transporter [Caulobacter radicis]
MATTTNLHRGVRDLTQGPVGATLFSFALPTLASSVLQSLGGSVNSIWVGRFLGEEALAATINGNMVSFLMMALAFGAGMSATILVGRAVGAGDLGQARRIMGTGFGAFAAISIAVAVLGWMATPTILRVLGTPAGAEPLAEVYLRFTFIGAPGALLASLLLMGLRGCGDSISPMWFTIATVAVDVVLNPLLILGLGPLPRLGVGGAALALALANYVTLLAICAWIYWRDLAIRLRGREIGCLLPDPRLLWDIFCKGLPMGLQMIVMTVAAMTILRLVNREGVATAAAYGVAQQLWGYLQLPAMAVSAGVSTLSAQAIGARDWPRVKEIVRHGVVASLILTLGCVVTLHTIGGQLIGLFVGQASPIIPLAKHIIWMTSIGFCFFAMSSTLFASLRADGVVVRPLLISCLALFGVRLGCAYSGYPIIGANALWLSLTAGQFATWLMAAGLYKLEAQRRHIRRREEEQVEKHLALQVEDGVTA